MANPQRLFASNKGKKSYVDSIFNVWVTMRAIVVRRLQNCQLGSGYVSGESHLEIQLCVHPLDVLSQLFNPRVPLLG